MPSSCRFTSGRTRYPLYRRLDGPQSRSGQVRKISPPPGFDPRTIQAVESRYTVWAIPIPTRLVSVLNSTFRAERCPPLFIALAQGQTGRFSILHKLRNSPWERGVDTIVTRSVIVMVCWQRVKGERAGSEYRGVNYKQSDFDQIRLLWMGRMWPVVTVQYPSTAHGVVTVFCFGETARAGNGFGLNLLNTKRNPLYISNQFVPRCKHFPPRL
jgi:hypothetical protein